MSIQVGARFLSYLFLFISTSVATLIISLLRVHVRVWRSGWHSCGTLAVWVRLCISKQFAMLSRTTISYDVTTSTSSMINLLLHFSFSLAGIQTYTANFISDPLHQALQPHRACPLHPSVSAILLHATWPLYTTTVKFTGIMEGNDLWVTEFYP